MRCDIRRLGLADPISACLGTRSRRSWTRCCSELSHTRPTGIEIVVSAFVAPLILRLGIWYPGIYVYGRQNPWYDVQIWARDHSAKDAVFITPPYIWWFYESDWRVFSERSSVVSLSDLLEVAFAPNYVATWEQRFNAVAPGALARLNGDDFENGALAAQAYYSLSDDDVLRAACRYSASYLVVEKPHLRKFQAVYENQQFVIYGLPLECPATAKESLRGWIDEESAEDFRKSSDSTGRFPFKGDENGNLNSKHPGFDG